MTCRVFVGFIAIPQQEPAAPGGVRFVQVVPLLTVFITAPPPVPAQITCGLVGSIATEYVAV
jgi:hypothetical protein